MNAIANEISAKMTILGPGVQEQEKQIREIDTNWIEDQSVFNQEAISNRIKEKQLKLAEEQDLIRKIERETASVNSEIENGKKLAQEEAEKHSKYLQEEAQRETQQPPTARQSTTEEEKIAFESPLKYQQQ